MKVGRCRSGGSLAIILAIWSSLILTTSAAGQNSPNTEGGDAWKNPLLYTAESLLVADMFQTQYILKNKDKYDELNPLLDYIGPNYAPLYFLFWMVATPVIGEWLLPADWKDYFYGGMILIEGAAVGNNISIGVKFAY